MNLEGIVDVHVHTEPDVRPRSCDDLQLAREAVRVRAGAVVIKSHHFVTADRAVLARKAVPGAAVYGGITLNPSVGGLNPAAIEAALKVGAKIIWLPTLFATNHRLREGRDGGVPVVIDGNVVAAAREVFRMVAAADAVLATGHQSATEIRLIVAEAWRCGVRRVLINHPEHEVVGLTCEDQRQLRQEFPVWFERCFAQPAGGGRYRTNFDVNLQAIEAVGWESTILATDVGQVENPPWAACWEQMLEFYTRRGLPDPILQRLVSAHARQLLGL